MLEPWERMGAIVQFLEHESHFFVVIRFRRLAPASIFMGTTAAYAFFGSSTTAYGVNGDDRPRVGSADVLCQLFLANVLDGASIGRCEARRHRIVHSDFERRVAVIAKELDGRIIDHRVYHER